MARDHILYSILDLLKGQTLDVTSRSLLVERHLELRQLPDVPSPTTLLEAITIACT